jgi:PAS domain S-box-containing protein
MAIIKKRSKTSKQKQAENELAGVSQQLEDLARFPQENPNPILSVDLNGSILSANHACSLLDLDCQLGQVLPRRYLKIVAEVLKSGSHRVIEAKGKEGVFSLDFVPLASAGYVNIYGNDITERKRAEESLHETQKDLKRAQAVAQIGSWRLDVQHNKLLWSEETHRIFGIPRGKPMTYETFLSAVHPEDKEYVDRKWEAALQGEDYDIEHRIIVDDKVKWVHEKAELEFDKEGMLKGGFGTVQDITGRKKTEENLRQTRDYLDNLFTYANAPIIVWDPKLKITRFNHAFERLTGRSAGEVLGKKVDVLIPADRRDEALKKINRTTQMGERWEVVEIPIQHADGSIRTVLWNSATLCTPDGKTPLATIAQGQDITELKKTDRLKDEFIGLVSHELRTPLTVISGSLRSAMSPGISPEDARELLQNAVEGADQLAAILENMLELSRYQADRLQLRMELVNIADEARVMLERLKGQGAGQRFSMDFPADLPLVEADPVRVERILYNLVENAVKYSPAQSEIKVSGRRKGDFVTTAVSDQGKGIPDGERGKLFELFSRLEESSYAKGAGLGLVVCKRLVEAQGGWIKVDSAPGKGSTFTFALPIRRARA